MLSPYTSLPFSSHPLLRFLRPFTLYTLHPISPACAGCKFVWEKTDSLLDESAGYEATKDAFERVCANVPDVFFDAVRFQRESCRMGEVVVCVRRSGVGTRVDHAVRMHDRAVL